MATFRDEKWVIFSQTAAKVPLSTKFEGEKTINCHSICIHSLCVLGVKIQIIGLTAEISLQKNVLVETYLMTIPG